MYRNLKLKKLKGVIQNDVLVTDKTHGIVMSGGKRGKWLFDFRKILLQPEYLDLVSELFWERYKSRYPFQVGGLESAAIPLVAGIVMKSRQKGKPVNGFFIRKSRKSAGLQKLIEGELNEHKIILVDDLLNSGRTFTKQIKILKKLDRRVSELFTIVRFRKLASYTPITSNNLKLTSLFVLPDFNKPFLDAGRESKQPMSHFNNEWYFKSLNPNYHWVVPKSTPCLDESKLYFGSDSGYFWALNQKDGTTAWKFKVGWPARGKSIFSSPQICNTTVYFGSYDGNVYALDTETGKRKWVFREADWIGSSPAVAPELNLLFIGLEFGLIKKRGGVAALDLSTGKKKWEYIMPEYTHSSPAYLPAKNIVAIGSNDSCVYLFNAKSGKLLWKFKVDGEVKASLAFDEARGNVLFGSHDGYLYVVDIQSGKFIFRYQTQDVIYSTPLIIDNLVYVASLDKRLYCIDLNTHKLVWSFATGGRIFSSPKKIEGSIYIGSNDGTLYELEPKTGKLKGSFTCTERITNGATYNVQSKRFFVSTFANEIYCLTRKSPN